MKVVILAGGRGSRLAEETAVRPKPMVEIGGMPILWHIMKGYGAFGYQDFVVALGYKGDIIKDYFVYYYYRTRNITVKLDSGVVEVEAGPTPEPWQVLLADTGLNTETGGRLRRLRDVLQNRFMMTYGDGLADIDIASLVRFHESHGRLATVTVVRPPARFGSAVLEGGRVLEFSEKPQAEGGWINGGFFVLEPEIFEYIGDDSTVWERGPLEALADAGQLMAFQHAGFWQPMDTFREKLLLEELWRNGGAPWCRHWET